MNPPYTGMACGCRKGLERDNCRDCEGSGKQIDWPKFHKMKLDYEDPNDYVGMGWVGQDGRP